MINMSSKDNMIGWMTARKGIITYSMDWKLRQGPNHYDCSSAVFSALIAGGFVPTNTGLGNTETLFGLEGTLLIPIRRSEVRRGDVFVAGRKGGSLGSGGHTGIFLDNHTIIHCTYGYEDNNIAVTPAKNWMGDYSGLPVYYYRLAPVSGIKPPITENKPQMTILVVDGSWGPATTKRLQEYFGLSIRDEVISGQIKTSANANIPSVQFGRGGSNLIRAMQEWLGVEVDGNFGPATCRALQRKFGTIEDGVISLPSDVVKELQRRLNNNKL